ncbi:MAG TPA: hypothetical protein VN253_09030 [Kofleriaceae bacterium]|nr:hypothetical protein [Kofleriaceae bacterium]
MSLVFEAESFDTSVGGPIAQGATAILEKRIGFHVKADYKVAYKPYVVLVTSPQDARGDVKFKFVNCRTGNLVSDVERTINARDLTIAYSESPSTLPTQNEFESGLRVGFFMLRRDALLGELAADADASEVEPIHKYPRTAALTDEKTRRLLASYKNQILALLALPGVNTRLDAAEKSRIQALLEQSA